MKSSNLILLILYYIIFVTSQFFIFYCCNENPSNCEHINPFDPQSEYGDNIPPTIRLALNTTSGITKETVFIFDASKSSENDNPDLTFSTGAIPAGSILNVFAVNDGMDVFLIVQFQNGNTAQIDPI